MRACTQKCTFEVLKSISTVLVEILAVVQRILNDTPNRLERSMLHSIKRDVWLVSETRVTSNVYNSIEYISR